MAPFTVQFSDLSTGNPTEWIWQFGDGGTSRVQNPSYTYNRPGLYEVQLTVVNEQGSDSKMLDTTILVEAPPPPPKPVIRNWRIAGVMRIWDDENFGGDERGEHSLSDNRTLIASQPIQAYDIRRCTGKEVVGEIHLQLRLEDQGAIRVVGSLLYFEEDSCNADDLEKRQNIEYLLQPGQSEHVRFKLGDGDGSVDFDFTMTNTGD